MPTEVTRRSGRYSVRISLNVSEDTSRVLDLLERRTGEPRGVIAREALTHGLVALDRLWRARVPGPGRAENGSPLALE